MKNLTNFGMGVCPKFSTIVCGFKWFILFSLQFGNQTFRTYIYECPGLARKAGIGRFKSGTTGNVLVLSFTTIQYSMSSITVKFDHEFLKYS
jgi:hypothetical protein